MTSTDSLDIGTQWERSTEDENTHFTREEALSPLPHHPLASDDITITATDDSAYVAEPLQVDDSLKDASHTPADPDKTTLQVTYGDTGLECAEILTRFIDRHLERFEDGRYQSSPTDWSFSELLTELNIIYDVSPSLNPQIKSLYNQYESTRDKRIAERRPTLAAVIYIVCRLNDEPIQHEDLETNWITNKLAELYISSFRVKRFIRKIQEELPIDVTVLNDPKKEIDVATETLDLPTEVEELARMLADNHIKYDSKASGLSPSAIAGAAIYNAATHLLDYEDSGKENPITQGEIADSLGMSEVTIRNHYQDQWELLKDEFDEIQTQEDPVN